MCGPAAAPDLCQEVFLRLYGAGPRYREEGAFGTWIYRIAVNECYAHLRKRRVKLVFEGDSPEDGSIADLQSAKDGPPTTLSLRGTL